MSTISKLSMFLLLTALSIPIANAAVIYHAPARASTTTCNSERWVPGHWYKEHWVPGHYVKYSCHNAAQTTTVAHPYHRHPVTRSTVRHAN